jgi:hypothetical protein
LPASARGTTEGRRQPQQSGKRPDVENASTSMANMKVVLFFVSFVPSWCIFIIVLVSAT